MKGKKYGMRDYYNFFCEQNPHVTISAQKFNDIVSEFNKEMANSLIDDLIIRLPFRLGNLEILKTKRKVYFDSEGNLKNTIPVDWKATNELWEKDEDAKKRKLLIRYSNINTNGYVFKIYYIKKNAIFKNKSIYFFKPVRSIKRKIADRINDYSKEKYDTYVKKKYNV